MTAPDTTITFGIYRITWTLDGRQCVVYSIVNGCIVDTYSDRRWQDTGRLPDAVRAAAALARPRCSETREGHQCVHAADHRINVTDHPSGKAPGERSDCFHACVGWWSPTEGARKCYACDATAVGLRDRRPEGGKVERACVRHTDPTIPVTVDQ